MKIYAIFSMSKISFILRLKIVSYTPPLQKIKSTSFRMCFLNFPHTFRGI